MLQLLIGIATAFLVGIDQYLKILATVHLKGKPPFVLIDGVFEFFYLENPGASFGLFKNQRWIFILVTIIVVIGLLVVLMSGYFRKHHLFNIGATLIVAGGIGNLIDRIFQGYVVDFLYFKLINFPIFNFADSCVVVGAGLLIVFFFFFYEDKSKLTKSEETQTHECENMDSSSGEDGGEN